ncbi:hypothetical protein [Streptomyces diastatochromogenes]|uniref:hypothetical protein n=1 Tax=Streptomyces diastatochromogenes TaxID=42236 RepID=UPI0036ACEFF9
MSSPATAPPAPPNVPRIVAAGLIGTTNEWYDRCLAGLHPTAPEILRQGRRGSPLEDMP